MALGLTFEDVVEWGRFLPGIEVSTGYGTPSLKVKGKMLVRMKEDGESMVLRTSFVVRDHLMHAQPAIFYSTDHYREYPSVLVHLRKVARKHLRELLEAAWRETAPAKFGALHDLTSSGNAKLT